MQKTSQSLIADILNMFAVSIQLVSLLMVSGVPVE